MDTCPPSAPEYEVNRRYIEQVSMIIAANSNVDYSAAMPTVSTIPALENEVDNPQILRRPRKEDE